MLLIARAGFAENHHSSNRPNFIPAIGQIPFRQLAKFQSAIPPITTGLVFRTCDWLSLSAGVGYGSRTLLWEDSSLNWARVSDRSPRGIAADIALHFRIRSFRLYAGVSTAAFRTCDYEFGLGFCF